MKMASLQETGYCVIQFDKTIVECEYDKCYRKGPPQHKSVYTWCKQFENEGCICKGKSPGYPCVTDEAVQHVRDAFQCIPWKSAEVAMS